MLDVSIWLTKSVNLDRSINDIPMTYGNAFMSLSFTLLISFMRKILIEICKFVVHLVMFAIFIVGSLHIHHNVKSLYIWGLFEGFEDCHTNGSTNVRPRGSTADIIFFYSWWQSTHFQPVIPFIFLLPLRTFTSPYPIVIDWHHDIC